MSDLIVSINQNHLRISLVDIKEGFKSCTEDLTENVLQDRKIVDLTTFSSILSNSISKITKQKAGKLLLNFVLEPQDVTLRFITVNKNGLSADEQVMAEIKNKIEDINLEDYYFSYQKIAPFLFQFIGVRKDVLEPLLEVSNNVGIPIKSIVPWTLLLPKYVKINNPGIFICKRDERQVVAISELNGIFFTGVYEKDKTGKELSNFVQELSFYKRDAPITKVYTLNYDNFDLPGYEISKVEMPASPLDPDETSGYEVNVLVSYMTDTEPAIIDSQVNVLNMLPLPEVSKSAPVAVYAVVTILVIAVAAGAFFLFSGKNKASSGNNLAQSSNQSNVLSDTNKASDTSPKATPQPTPILNRSDLKIMVENGSGVSGLAAKSRDFLTNLGYTVIGIDTADQQTTSTILKFKKSKEGFKDMVVADIRAKFPSVTVDDSLSESSNYDLLLTIGTSETF